MAKEYIKLWDSYESYFESYSAAEVGRLVLAMMKYKSQGVEPCLLYTSDAADDHCLV